MCEIGGYDLVTLTHRHPIVHTPPTHYCGYERYPFGYPPTVASLRVNLKNPSSSFRKTTIIRLK